MTLFGYTLSLSRKSTVTPLGVADVPSLGGRGWWPMIRESFAGAWQRGRTIVTEDVLQHCTAWACITLIAFDIAKMRVKLVQENADGITEEVDNSAYSPVLARPNHYQNRIQFYLYWIISKLTSGKTFVLKERDGRGVVTALYILDPYRVKPLVAPNGDVYFQLSADTLAGVEAGVIAPASEIIHDIYIAPYHPLCGVSPIYALAMTVNHGLRLLDNVTRLFQNGSHPGGVLTAPGAISPESAKRAQDWWDANFTGEDNVGKVAVLGDGLRFEKMGLTAVEAQVIDQLNWGDIRVCSAYHVPGYMVGVGAVPTYNNIEALNQQYYSQCLQQLIESLELCLDEGLELKKGFCTEFDVEGGLLRLDTATRMKYATDGVKGSIFTPNEGRLIFNKKPVAGGDSIWMQQQNFSLEALAKRDASADPFKSAQPSAPPAPPADSNADTTDTGDTQKEFDVLIKAYDELLDPAA